MAGSVKRQPTIDYKPVTVWSGIALVVVPAAIGFVCLLSLYWLWTRAETLSDREAFYTEAILYGKLAFDDVIFYNIGAPALVWEKKEDPRSLTAEKRQKLVADLAALIALTSRDPEQQKLSLQLQQVALSAIDTSQLSPVDITPEDNLVERTIKQGQQTLVLVRNILVWSLKWQELLELQNAKLAVVRSEQSSFATLAKTASMAGLVGSLCAAALLLLIFNRNFQSRLAPIMKSTGDLLVPGAFECPVKGNDELAYLTVSLANVKSQLTAAEKRRKAIFEMVAHDVRSPLSASSISLEILRKTCENRLTPSSSQRLDQARNQLDATLSLVNDLLSAESLKAVPPSGAANANLPVGKVRPKLFQTILVIALAPVLLQAAMLISINFQIVQAEHFARIERQQGDLIFSYNRLALNMVTALSATGLYVATQKPQLKTLADRQISEIGIEASRLKSLLAVDPNRKELLALITEKIGIVTPLLSGAQPKALFGDVAGSYQKVLAIKSLMTSGLFTQLDHQVKLIENRQKLERDRNAHRKSAAAVRLSILAGLAANFVLMLVLLFFWARNVNERFAVLLKNVKHLPDSSYVPISVTGADELEQLNSVLQRAAEALKEERAARRKMLAALTDQLRTPLVNVQTAVRDIESDNPDLPVSEVEELQSASANIDRVLNLIEDLTDADTLESGQLALEIQRCDLANLIRDAVASVKVLASVKNIRIVENAPPILADVDGARFRQVLENILSNAIKFSPSGAQIDIEASLLDGLATIQISDTGPGIPQELVNRVFERHFRVAGDVQGFGLGLSIAKDLVELHGGHISIQNRQPTGCIFSLSIPQSGGK